MFCVFLELKRDVDFYFEKYRFIATSGNAAPFRREKGNQRKVKSTCDGVKLSREVRTN